MNPCHPLPKVWVALTLWVRVALTLLVKVALVWGWFFSLFLLNALEMVGDSIPVLSLQDICAHWDDVLQSTEAFTQWEVCCTGPHLHTDGAQDSSMQIQGELKLKTCKSKLHLELVTIANMNTKSWRRCRAWLFWQAVIVTFFREKGMGSFGLGLQRS